MAKEPLELLKGSSIRSKKTSHAVESKDTKTGHIPSTTKDLTKLTTLFSTTELLEDLLLRRRQRHPRHSRFLLRVVVLDFLSQTVKDSDQTCHCQTRIKDLWPEYIMTAVGTN